MVHATCSSTTVNVRYRLAMELRADIERLRLRQEPDVRVSPARRRSLLRSASQLRSRNNGWILNEKDKRPRYCEWLSLFHGER